MYRSTMPSSSSRHYHSDYYNNNNDNNVDSNGIAAADDDDDDAAGGDVSMMRSLYTTGHYYTDRSTRWGHHGMGGIRRQLEEFLESRPDAEELLSRHILHSISVAPCLLQKSEQIMWQSRMRLLQRKMRYRPKRSELLEKGIVRADVDSKEFLHLVEGLESKLSRRPGRVELVSKHILQQHDVNPHIQSLQQMILSSRGDTGRARKEM